MSIFNSLCGRHGRWEVWSDFIQLTAIDISNVTDKGNAPKRAADARNIAKKYSEDEIKRMAEMLMQMVYAIDENPDQDFLGELYMTCELGNDHAGQFFTPYDVCRAMSEISFDPTRFEDKGFVSVNDCACGAGALLVSFANACKRHDINYQQKVMFVAQDIDYTVGLMCYIQLSVDDAKAGAGLRDQTTDSRGLTKIVIDYASNVQAMAVYNLAQQLDLVAPGYYRSRYIDAAKTAQYIEIGQISAGDAEHVTTLCKKAAIEYKTAA